MFFESGFNAENKIRNAVKRKFFKTARRVRVVTLKGEQPCGTDDAAQGFDTRLDM